MNRRDLVSRGVVGGAVVWVTPTVWSVPAGAAVGSTPPVTTVDPSTTTTTTTDPPVPGANLIGNPSFQDGQPDAATPGWTFR